MRDPNRLYMIYDQIRSIHMEHFPDWRVGQLMSNFMGFVMRTHGVDPFFVEEDKFLEYLNEFCEESSREKYWRI